MIQKLQLIRLSNWGIAAEYLLLALCGAGFTLAFPGIDWNILAWIGAVPVCLAVLHCSPGGAFLRAFVWSWFWNFTAFFWLREIVGALPVGMAFTLASFTAIWACAAAWIRKYLEFSPSDRLKGVTHCNELKPFSHAGAGILFLLGSAGFWCVTEWVRSWIFTGLPWNLLAAAQWRTLPLIQICEYTGIYGVSFCVILFNMALAMTLPHIPGLFRKNKRYWPLSTALLILAFAFLSGTMLMIRASKLPTRPFRAGVIQCDLTQRRVPVAGQGEEAVEVCTRLTEELLKNEFSSVTVSLDSPSKPQVPLSVVIWPETAVPVPYRSSADLAGLYRKEVSRILTKYRTPLLVGSLDFEMNPNAPYGYDMTNSALLIREPGGKIADKFSKIHIVPFGEYVPFGDKYPFLNRLVGMGRNLRAGERFNPIEIGPGVRAGISICFESVFPFVSRGHRLNGANLLMVLSNDAWYPTSNEPEQHFANALFRAVENRIPLLRCGNSSHTLWIDQCGIVRDTVLSNLHDRGRGQKVFTVQIPTEAPLTFYARFGNIFIILCGFFVFCAIVPAITNWNLFRLAQGEKS